MRAKPGDRLVIKGHRVGEPERDGEILETHRPEGGPPFLVQWSEDGRIVLLFPGPDAVVEPLGRRKSRRRRAATTVSK